MELMQWKLHQKDYEHNLSHWSLNNNGGDSCEGGDEISGEDLIIKTPISAYGHWEGTGTFQLSMRSDFPNAAQLSMSGDAHLFNDFTVRAQVKDGYQFVFWGRRRPNDDVVDEYRKSGYV